MKTSLIVVRVLSYPIIVKIKWAIIIFVECHYSVLFWNEDALIAKMAKEVESFQTDLIRALTIEPNRCDFHSTLKKDI